MAYNFATSVFEDLMQLLQRFRQREYQFWLLQLIGWTGWMSMFAVRDMYWGQPLERIQLLLGDAIVGAMLTTILRYVYRYVWEKHWAVRVVAILVASGILAPLWQGFKNGYQFWYYNDFDAVKEYGIEAYFSNWIGYSYWLFLAWSGLYFGIKFYQLLEEERRRTVRAESMAHQAQLRMLRYQLNPHFLFNTLNAISTLILEKENDTANRMVSKLSNFLRYSLDKDPMQKVDLAHELSTMKLYLEIEQVRFDERLRIDIDVTPEARTAMVPSLLLQPLVENSIKYAVANRESGGLIAIKAEVIDGRLRLEVSDDGPGIEFVEGKKPLFNGVGLANTRERLQELYNSEHECVIRNAEGGGLCVAISIPFEKETMK